ncbi:hypothetical protein [uncultured Helicobacter sp.]|uniref:hypothetical protein n=1 Tax=uncultured Helicobacter sp. TaxID=175537 RepID=UPI0025E26A68|nr:hypothetical protein [uncultured Helicobacter sp.]
MKKYRLIFVLLLVGYTTSYAEQSPKQSVIESIPTLTNPFKHSSTQNLELKAIVNNKVLLNQEWHKLGDVVEGYTIIALHPQAIILQKSSSRFKLSFNGELEKLEP